MSDTEAMQCACGHDRATHEHYRRGSDCALCECDRFRRSRIRLRAPSQSDDVEAPSPTDSSSLTDSTSLDEATPLDDATSLDDAIVRHH
jgi:hypothetical protein